MWAYFVTVNTLAGPIEARLWGTLNDDERRELLNGRGLPEGITERAIDPRDVRDLADYPVAFGTFARLRAERGAVHAGDYLTIRAAFQQARAAAEAQAGRGRRRRST